MNRRLVCVMDARLLRFLRAKGGDETRGDAHTEPEADTQGASFCMHLMHQHESKRRTQGGEFGIREPISGFAGKNENSKLHQQEPRERPSRVTRQEPRKDKMIMMPLMMAIMVMAV